MSIAIRLKKGLHVLTDFKWVLGKLGLGKLGPGRLGPSKIWRQIGPRQIGPFLGPNLPFFGKLGPGKLGPSAANWAPANGAPEKFGCGKLGPIMIFGCFWSLHNCLLCNSCHAILC